MGWCAMATIQPRNTVQPDSSGTKLPRAGGRRQHECSCSREIGDFVSLGAGGDAKADQISAPNHTCARAGMHQ